MYVEFVKFIMQIMFLKMLLTFYYIDFILIDFKMLNQLCTNELENEWIESRGSECCVGCGLTI